MRIGPETFGKLDGIQYHVGHMVPNEVINRQFGRLAQMETFFMSNMSPQRGSLNTGVWLELEARIRQIEDTPGKDHVWVVIGPIFGDDPQTIERPNDKRVSIPDAYYCITADPFRYPWDRKSNVDVACFRIPQDARPLRRSKASSSTSMKSNEFRAVAAELASSSANDRHGLLRQLH